MLLMRQSFCKDINYLKISGKMRKRNKCQMSNIICKMDTRKVQVYASFNK